MAINGWDERDYKLGSAVRTLPSYGLIENGNRMISEKQVLELLERHAEQRFTARLSQVTASRKDMPAALTPPAGDLQPASEPANEAILIRAREAAWRVGRRIRQSAIFPEDEATKIIADEMGELVLALLMDKSIKAHVTRSTPQMGR